MLVNRQPQTNINSLLLHLPVLIPSSLPVFSFLSTFKMILLTLVQSKIDLLDPRPSFGFCAVFYLHQSKFLDHKCIFTVLIYETLNPSSNQRNFFHSQSFNETTHFISTRTSFAEFTSFFVYLLLRSSSYFTNPFLYKSHIPWVSNEFLSLGFPLSTNFYQLLFPIWTHWCRDSSSYLSMWKL